MSLDILQPFTPPPVKRAREKITLASDGSSKCAEIFVTNNADKWTFFCAHCQQATTDIGVLICHIRLEHLEPQPLGIVTANSSKKKKNVNRKAELTTNTDVECLPSPQSDIVKEEETLATNQENLQPIRSKVVDITDISLKKEKDINETENVIDNKEFIVKSEQNSTTEDNKVIFTITPIDSQLAEQQLVTEQANKEITQNVYVKNEATEKNDDEDDFNNTTTNEISKEEEDTNENAQSHDSDSYYSPDTDNEDDDTDFEINEANEASDSNKPKRMKRAKASYGDSVLLTFNCPYCPSLFKSKQSLTCHMKHRHEKQLPVKCKKCQKGFLTANRLRVHLKSHDQNNYSQCPVCQTDYIEKQFITHVLTHESDTCFPCQVCGKIFTSPDERKTHWTTHSKEKPFACKFCYRRYSHQHYLTRHLKIHNQYHCYFCPAEFTATETLQPPYVCKKCEKSPDIKQRLEYVSSLSDSNPIYNSNEDITETANLAEELPSSNELNEHDINDSTTQSSYSLNDTIPNDEDDGDDDEDGQTNEDDLDLEFLDDLPSTSTLYKCKYCKRDFNTKPGLALHISKCHIIKKPVACDLKCEECQRVFESKSALYHHRRFHDKNNLFKCPVCRTTKLGEAGFITHVMLHESDTCFPCQVCGKIFDSDEKRLAHWQLHAKDKPHGCDICKRRFSQKYILQRHLKTHNQYSCHFCLDEFSSPHSLKPPYVCKKCEKLPDIETKIEQQLSFMSHKKAYYSQWNNK